MEDNVIIGKLIARDGEVTQKFFFEDCRPLFRSIIKKVFSYDVDYDEFVSEFYIHLMEDDARLLGSENMSPNKCAQYMKIENSHVPYILLASRHYMDNTEIIG